MNKQRLKNIIFAMKNVFNLLRKGNKKVLNAYLAGYEDIFLHIFFMKVIDL